MRKKERGGGTEKIAALHVDIQTTAMSMQLSCSAASVKRQAPHLVVECSAGGRVMLPPHALIHYSRKCFYF